MILLKFEQAIKGDSITDGYKDWITCTSLQWGVGRSISASGNSTDRETSNPSFSEVTLTKSTDVASTALLAQATHGKSLGKATIAFINTHEQKAQCYMLVELHDAIVSAYSASSGGNRPDESVSINFTKQVVGYKQFDGTSLIATDAKGWDLQANKVFNEIKWP